MCQLCHRFRESAASLHADPLKHPARREELEDQLEGVGPDQAAHKHAPMEAAE